MSRSYVGAYWGPRRQSVDECADQLAQLLPAMAAIDPALMGWRNLGKSKRQALAQPVVTTDHSDLVKRLLDDRIRNDIKGEVIEDLGYSLYWWNSIDDSRAAAKLSVHIAATSAAVGNSVVLNLPDPESVPGLYTPDTAHKLMHTIVQIFDPDSAVWCNHDLRKKQSEPDQPLEGGGYRLGQVIGYPAGWANYLSDRDTTTFDSTLIPPTASIERIGNGTLVMLGDDPANPPFHAVLAMRAAMGYPVTFREQEATPPAGVPASVPGSATAKADAVHYDAARQAKPSPTPTAPESPDRAHGDR